MKKNRETTEQALLNIYNLLLAHFGPLHWWPGDSPFEVMVGAILTQNTAWTNVEKAVANLKAARMLSPRAIASAPLSELAALIRPSGYFNQKAARLQDFCRFFLAEPFRGSARRMAAMDTIALRAILLAQKGIGPETADSILLYALDKPVFVVDAYTRRAFARLGFLPPDVSYHETQDFFVKRLPIDVALYNDFHAQVVYLGKDFCQKKPRCAECPLKSLKRCRPERV